MCIFCNLLCPFDSCKEVRGSCKWPEIWFKGYFVKTALSGLFHWSHDDRAEAFALSSQSKSGTQTPETTGKIQFHTIERQRLNIFWKAHPEVLTLTSSTLMAEHFVSCCCVFFFYPWEKCYPLLGVAVAASGPTPHTKRQSELPEPVVHQHGPRWVSDKDFKQLYLVSENTTNLGSFKQTKKIFCVSVTLTRWPLAWPVAEKTTSVA